MYFINNEWEKLDSMDEIKRVMADMTSTEAADAIGEAVEGIIDERTEEMGIAIMDLQDEKTALASENVFLQGLVSSLQDDIEYLKEKLSEKGSEEPALDDDAVPLF